MATTSVGSFFSSSSQAVQAWAGESRYYVYRTNECQVGVCGHYTQVVSRATKEVGCSAARGDDREVWVCNFDPPANRVGSRLYWIDASSWTIFSVSSLYVAPSHAGR